MIPKHYRQRFPPPPSSNKISSSNSPGATSITSSTVIIPKQFPSASTTPAVVKSYFSKAIPTSSCIHICVHNHLCFITNCIEALVSEESEKGNYASGFGSSSTTNTSETPRVSHPPPEDNQWFQHPNLFPRNQVGLHPTPSTILRICQPNFDIFFLLQELDQNLLTILRSHILQRT